MMMVMVEVVVATAAADAAMMISSGFGIVLIFSCIQTEFSCWHIDSYKILTKQGNPDGYDQPKYTWRIKLILSVTAAFIAYSIHD